MQHLLFRQNFRRTKSYGLGQCRAHLFYGLIFLAKMHDERRRHESVKETNTLVYSAFGYVFSISSLVFFKTFSPPSDLQTT